MRFDTPESPDADEVFLCSPAVIMSSFVVVVTTPVVFSVSIASITPLMVFMMWKKTISSNK